MKGKRSRKYKGASDIQRGDLKALLPHLDNIEGIVNISNARELGFIAKYKNARLYAKYVIDIKNVYDLYEMKLPADGVMLGDKRITTDMIYPSAECETKIITLLMSRIDESMLGTIADYYGIIEIDLSNVDEIEKSIANNKYTGIVLNERVRDHIKNGHIYNKLYIIYIELLDLQIDKFINYNCDSVGWNLILDIVTFQMMYTMYVLNVVFGDGCFMHNDIHEGNIMIKYDNDYVYEYHKKTYDIYHVNGKKYWLPYLGFTIKLIDFGYSIASNDGIYNAIVLDKMSDMRQWPNDIIGFIETVLSTCTAVESYAMTLFTRLDAAGKYYKIDPNADYIEVFDNRAYGDLVRHMMINAEWDRFLKGDDGGEVHREYKAPCP